MITAGIHGTEIAGMLVAQELRNLQIVRGTLIVVPIVNVRAYHQKTRGKPDVNRTFPRKFGDKPRYYIAKQVFDLAEKYNPSWCIDLHEANGFYKLDHAKLGQTLIAYPNQQTVQTARRVVQSVNRLVTNDKRKFSVRQGKLPGSFRTAVGKVLHTHAVTVETSMQQPRKVRVRYQIHIVKALLREIGLL